MPIHEVELDRATTLLPLHTALGTAVLLTMLGAKGYEEPRANGAGAIVSMRPKVWIKTRDWVLAQIHRLEHETGTKEQHWSGHWRVALRRLEWHWKDRIVWRGGCELVVCGGHTTGRSEDPRRGQLDPRTTLIPGKTITMGRSRLLGWYCHAHVRARRLVRITSAQLHKRLSAVLHRMGRNTTVETSLFTL